MSTTGVGSVRRIGRSDSRGLGWPVAVTAMAVLVGAPMASGQQLLLELSSNRGTAGDHDLFGASVSTIGDIDGDGVQDFVVGASEEDDGVAPYTSTHGAAYVLSGSTGAVLHHIGGENTTSEFGLFTAAGSDLDGDGVADYLVTADLETFGNGMKGKLYAYSGATGALLFSMWGEQLVNYFGQSVALLGDLDGDGVDDIGAWSPRYATKSAMGGRGYLLSGQTASVIKTYTGSQQSESVGDIVRLGDIDGDGKRDFGIAAAGFTSGPNGAGTFDVMSGATLKRLYHLDGANTRDRFGAHSGELGDLDGDRVPDFAVSADLFDVTPANHEGRVYVFSGATGAIVYQLDGSTKDEYFGYLPHGGPIDLNADGFADILVGSTFTIPNSGGKLESQVYAYSGRNGRMMYEFRGTRITVSSDRLGDSIAPAGDLNGDGIDDVIVGAPFAMNGKSVEGRAYVFAGNDLFLQANQSEYWPGDAITLDTRGGGPGQLTLVAVTDINGSPTFTVLAVNPLDANGEMQFADTVPPGLSGTTMSLLSLATRAGKHGLADSIVETITFK